MHISPSKNSQQDLDKNLAWILARSCMISQEFGTPCYILTRSYQDFYGISQVARFRKILEHTPPNLVTSC